MGIGHVMFAVNLCAKLPKMFDINKRMPIFA